MRKLSFTAVLMGSALLALPAEAAKVGVTAAVNPAATGRSAQEPERILQVGIDIQADERVVTTGSGRVQLLFLDGSGLSVGPNSDVKIDKFVYDPATTNGQLAVTAAKGVFRFVGGKISKKDEVQINTPSGTIGIRGGIATVSIAENGRTTANFLFGDRLTFRQGGQMQVATRPGSAMDGEPGQPPSSPRPSTPSELQAVNDSLQTSAPSGTPTNAPGAPAPGGQSGQGIEEQMVNSGAGAGSQSNPTPPVRTPPAKVVQPPADATKAQETVVNTPAPVVMALPTVTYEAGFFGGISGGYDGDFYGDIAESGDATLKLDGTARTASLTLGEMLSVPGGSSIDEDKVLRESVYIGANEFAAVSIIAYEGETGLDVSYQAMTSGDQELCACDYLKWGYWEKASYHVEIDESGEVTDRYDMSRGSGTWVTGQRTPVSVVDAATGTISYAGKMIGTRFQDGEMADASGHFQYSFNFGSRELTASANFDGISYATTSGGSITGNSFSAPDLTSGSGHTMSSRGAFFGPTMQNVGGRFDVEGPGDYRASGVYGGKRVPTLMAITRRR